MNTKRITRSRGDRMIAGVAAGLASYLGVDPLIVRIGFVVLTLMNGLGALLYITLWLLVPNEDSSATGRETFQEAVGEMQASVEQLAARVRSMLQRPG